MNSARGLLLATFGILAAASLAGACGKDEHPLGEQIATGATAGTTWSATSGVGGNGGDGGGTAGAGTGGGDATCVDQKQNGEETDVDCGGPNCNPCADELKCVLPADCASGVCEDMTCAVPTCTDGVKNQNEGDLDCGGNCPVNCFAGQKCNTNTDCDSNNCKLGIRQCPKDMAPVPVVGGGGTFCADSTEVTRFEYQTFWAANFQNVVPRCDWNDADGYTPTDLFPPTPATEKLPVVNIDWCDAANYCKWAGKHLCGKVGGGPNAGADFADPAKSEWMDACTAGGINVFPYGASYDDMICYGDDFTPDLLAPAAVRNMNFMVIAHCEGGAPSVYEMSGNVAEWDDACDEDPNDPSGKSDVCHVRGGSYRTGEAGLSCNANDTRLRGEDGPGALDVGFRCCQ